MSNLRREVIITGNHSRFSKTIDWCRVIVLSAFLLIGLSEPAWSIDKTKWMDLKREGQRLELERAYPAAEKFYRQSMEVARSFPKNCSERIETLYHMAMIYVLQGKYWEAEAYYKRLIELVEEQKKDGTLDHEALVWMEDLADAYSTHVKGWLEWMALEHAVTLRDHISGDNNKYMATTLRKLSTVLIRENKYREAEPYAERMVRLTSKFTGERELIKASDLYFLSLVQCNNGRYAKAESNCREALSLFTKLEKPPGFCTGNCHLQLAKILKCQSLFDLAEQSATRALKIFERTHGKKYIPASAAHNLLGEIYTRTGKYSNAVKEYEQVIFILEANYGPNHPLTVIALKDLKASYLKAKNPSKARAIERRLASISKPPTMKKAAHGH
jgi:tetratricopeptide (TPR) repeat protein